MSKSSPTLLTTNSILENRYRILSELGQGGFGRTYLAEDIQRYQEKCVLKEFVPQVKNTKDLQKAEELFQREAGILYQLQHEQIPEFRALLRVRVEAQDSLFLVQEYIEGVSYRELLEGGKKFTEIEVNQLLLDILPVLEYIHSLQIIHRDISPDNLIHRYTDGKTILIDFGCVKQAANLATQLTEQPIGTLIGKKGYAPQEQIRNGQAFPRSDLYALGITAIVLLTGKEPHELYDNYQATWRWREEVQVSSTLEDVLNKMLADQPQERYQSVIEVHQALEEPNLSNKSSIISQMRTLIVAPGNKLKQLHSQNNQSIPLSTQKANNSTITTQVNFNQNQSNHSNSNSQQNKLLNKLLGFLRFVLISSTAVILPGVITFALVRIIDWKPQFPSLPKASDVSLTQEEQDRQINIQRRIKALKLDSGSFYEQVDKLFYAKYPNLNKRKLSNSSKDRKYRERWYHIAENLLDKQEKI